MKRLLTILLLTISSYCMAQSGQYPTEYLHFYNTTHANDTAKPMCYYDVYTVNDTIYVTTNPDQGFGFTRDKSFGYILKGGPTEIRVVISSFYLDKPVIYRRCE